MLCTCSRHLLDTEYVLLLTSEGHATRWVGPCLGDCSLWLFHTHLIHQRGSSVVKQAASVPAEVTPLVIITSMGHLDVPEVLRNVRLDLPSKTQNPSHWLHIRQGGSKELTRMFASGLM